VGYGTLIREARKTRGWTQNVLAKRARVSAPTISRWELEQGNPPGWEHLDRLSPLLGIPMDALVEAVGIRLNPAPEDELYAPLAHLLHKMTLRQQKALYEFLVETSRGGDG
jgi:transcriptional regulator with XRE-family HTH domain